MGEALCTLERLASPVYDEADLGIRAKKGDAPVACRRARSFAGRLCGLLGTNAGYLHGGALLIEQCTSVHTFGMRYPIDVAFLDGLGRVLAVRRPMPPGRVAACRGSRAVIEREHDDGPWFDVGDEVQFIVASSDEQEVPR